MNFTVKSWLAASLSLLSVASVANAIDLNVWVRNNDESMAAYNDVAKAFTAKTGINIKYFNTLTDFEARIARSAAGRQLPDVVINDATAMGQMLTMGILEEVKPADIDGSDQVLDAAWQSARARDGKSYALPISAQSFALFVRKDWREKLGFPQPKTWKDVYDLAAAFTKKDPDGNGQADTFGFLFPGSTTRGYTSWFVSSFLWQAGGGFLLEQDGAFKPNLDTPENASALEFIRRLQCDGLTQPGAINATTADAVPSFRSGQTGMFFSGPYHISLFDNEPGRDKFEVLPPPAGAGGPESLAEGTSAFLMKGSEQADAAKSFLSFLISQDAQLIGMAVNGKALPFVRLPTNRNIDLLKVRDDSRWAVFADTFAAHSHYMPGISNWTPVRQITASDFNAILADCGSDIPAMLKAANANVATELQAQGVLAAGQ